MADPAALRTTLVSLASEATEADGAISLVTTDEALVQAGTRFFRAYKGGADWPEAMRQALAAAQSYALTKHRSRQGRQT